MSIDDRMADIARALRAGESVSETPRTIISWYNAQRRGSWITFNIKSRMDLVGIFTEPDFESAYIDERVNFCLRTPTSDSDADAVGLIEQVGVGTEASVLAEALVSTRTGDPVPRLRMLPAANRVPVSVRPDASIAEAVTKMLAHDFSQLPIMQNERSVRGMISWRSLGQAAALDVNPSRCAEASESPTILPADTPLLQAVEVIAREQVVLVSNGRTDSLIRGVVTTSDLSVQFKILAEPFLMLGEIENQIRILLGGRFTAAELKAVRSSADAGRDVEDLSDLSFGEYLRLMQNPAHWQRLGLKLDRSVLVERLDRVREIRNDVMHFDPDGLTAEDVDVLRDVVKLLQIVTTANRRGAEPTTG
jgi:CBS domain-containing protein